MPKTISIAAALAAVLALHAQAREGSTQASGNAYAKAACASCHGSEGRGTAAGPSVATGELSLSEFIDYVRRPSGTMRAYGTESLSDEELTEIYEDLSPAGGGLGPAGRAAEGAQLYRRTGCYECHSNEAQGGAQGPRLGPDPISFARFAWYVRHPSGAMPPYTEKVLTDADLADIYAFVEARPAPPPPGSIPLLAPPR